MPFVIPYPNLDPVLFTIPGLGWPIRWYALAYLGGLLIGLALLRRLMSRPALWPASTPPLTRDQVEALLTWMVLGVVIGGRLGYVLFYNPAFFWDHPGQILQVWTGGMSFHGGFLGVIVGLIVFCRLHRAPLMQVADAIAVVAPQGLLLGRLANFINGELWGRPTDVAWAMVFPRAGPLPRHPSQLYEAALEGALLFALMWLLATRRGWLKTPGWLTGLFFVGYGLARMFVEEFRQTDQPYITPENPAGHVLRFTAEYGLTMGQLLSLPMVLIGLGFWVWAARRKT